jgi:hypothetical protein
MMVQAMGGEGPGHDWPNHEPAGMSVILFADGSDKYFAESDAFYGARWLNDDDVAVVSDGDSKFGSAIEIRTRIDDTAGWHGIVSDADFDTSPDNWNEIYFRLVYQFSSNWQMNNSGDKWFYWGKANTSQPNDFYVLHQATHILITNQGGGGSFRNAWGDATVTYGEYHTLEIYIGGQTAGQADGFLQVWHDGQRVINQSGLEFFSDTPPNFEGYQAFLYWGGSGGTKTVNDYIRISEFFISGKQ